MFPFFVSANINFREPPSRLDTPQGVYFSLVERSLGLDDQMLGRSLSKQLQKPAKPEIAKIALSTCDLEWMSAATGPVGAASPWPFQGAFLIF